MNYFYDLPYEIQELIYKKVYFEVIKHVVNHPIIFTYKHLDLRCDFCNPPRKSKHNIYCAFCEYVNCKKCRNIGCGCYGRRLNFKILSGLDNLKG